MAIDIYSYVGHYNREIDGGELIINKPIGFPNEEAPVLPLSNLFTVQNFYCEYDRNLGLHTHKGFEIVTIVIRGGLDVWDSVTQEWHHLATGDFAIHEANKGILVQRKAQRQTQFIQIWLDPNLKESLHYPPLASYYRQADMYKQETARMKRIDIITADNDVHSRTGSVEINDYHFFNGNINIEIEPSYIYVGYMYKGTVELNNRVIEQDDFFIISDISKLNVNVPQIGRAIILELPSKVKYQTYYSANHAMYE
jgi:redox-sensitive bicupin YhaK (pirin superfamily)